MKSRCESLAAITTLRYVSGWLLRVSGLVGTRSQDVACRGKPTVTPGYQMRIRILCQQSTQPFTRLITRTRLTAQGSHNCWPGPGSASSEWLASARQWWWPISPVEVRNVRYGGPSSQARRGPLLRQKALADLSTCQISSRTWGRRSRRSSDARCGRNRITPERTCQRACAWGIHRALPGLALVLWWSRQIP